MSTRDWIGLAVIGAGYWGPNLVRNATATPALELRYLCDLDEERAAGQQLGWKPEVDLHGGLRELVAWWRAERAEPAERGVS